MTSSLISFVAEGEAHTERELPMPPIGYGLLAMGVFLALLAVLWSFRNTAAKLGDHPGKKPGH